MVLLGRAPDGEDSIESSPVSAHRGGRRSPDADVFGELACPAGCGTRAKTANELVRHVNSHHTVRFSAAEIAAAARTVADPVRQLRIHQTVVGWPPA